MHQPVLMEHSKHLKYKVLGWIDLENQKLPVFRVVIVTKPKVHPCVNAFRAWVVNLCNFDWPIDRRPLSVYVDKTIVFPASLHCILCFSCHPGHQPYFIFNPWTLANCNANWCWVGGWVGGGLEGKTKNVTKMKQKYR